jgi:beta-propeller repeat-containing protein
MHGTNILGIAWIAWLIQAAGVAQSEPPCPEAASLPSQALLSGASRERALLRFEGLPVYLVENVGQFHPDVHFFVKGREKSVFFTATGVTVRLCKDEKAHALQFLFEGARTEVRPDGHEQRSTVFSYFRGSDPDEWVRGARAYRAIVYRGLWPGIDLVCDTKGSRLKFTYRVHPGADPARIRIQVRGADGVTVDRQGALHLVTPVGELVDEPPIAHQVSGGRFLPVAVAYELHGGTGPKPTYSFRTGQYDRTLALEVDPAFLVYCGYIGGRLGEMIRGIAVDASGCLYVAGGTGSDQNTFPVKAGPDLTYGGDGDVFVAKVKADGTGLVFCGYLGGNFHEHAESLALDEAGCVYLTGTAGAGFPLKVGPNTHMGWGAFVTKLDATGTEIVYSGLIGGDRGAKGGGIAVDAAGHAYIVGETLSTEKTFPVKVGPDLTFNSAHPDVSDVFVARVDPRGESLDYCGYIGGLNADYSQAIAVDRCGRAYVAGYTWSSPQSFPVKVDSLVKTPVFVKRFCSCKTACCE